MNFQQFFSLSGMIVFSLVLFSNVYNLSYYWQDVVPMSKVSGCAMAFFYLVLVIVFYKQYKSSLITPQLSEAEVDSMLKDI